MDDRLWVPAAGVLAAIAVAVVLLLWWKGQPFAEGDVFRASRLSRGNRLFPTQVLITPTTVVHYTPELVGRKEHSIHIAHVSSVSIDTNLLFSNVLIETSGGTTPVQCHGHRKSDAVRMKQLIEQHQTQYYRAPAGGPPQEVARG
ncbi:MAG: hypothetical protein Q7R30_11855 [Acidobacteriota bacterium]|nr:hypothetical protein [Acidobacteriota bacterium]